MSSMAKIIHIDVANKTFTAQAGLQFIEASKALREQGLQFMTNIEIGNMTLGSAACCHTKDALDGIEFGQVSSYVTKIKWVTPDGNLAEASEADSVDELRFARSSYGLCGIVYEVTFRVKPIEALHFTYLPRPIEELHDAEVNDILDNSEGLVAWTVGRTCVFQRRQRVDDPGIFGSLVAAARRRLWNFGDAHAGHIIDQFLTHKTLRDAAQKGDFDVTRFLYGTLQLFGGIRYSPRTKPSTIAIPRRHPVCVYFLGIPPLPVVGDAPCVCGLCGSIFQDHRFSMQHAVRRLSHTAGH